ncbi:hypothetical protein ACFXA3_09260 [Streptomyces sp. NPDC059456]|uniref:hypothetical protein n=1 Tax=Streptomyces sp. NPDC059456 TaxID=3346838 RepID=UPI0036B1C80D
MNTQDSPRADGDFDVLGVYVETLRARMTPLRFRTLVRAVDTTCGLVSDEPAGTVTVPGDGFLPEDLRRGYMSLLAVMITGRIDHRLVEVPAPGGPSGWVVLEAGAAHDPAAQQAACHTVAHRHGERPSIC